MTTWRILFSEVAAIMDRWGSAKMLTQAHYIGRHLRGCTCATTAGRDFVHGIFDAMCEEATT